MLRSILCISTRQNGLHQLINSGAPRQFIHQNGRRTMYAVQSQNMCLRARLPWLPQKPLFNVSARSLRTSSRHSTKIGAVITGRAFREWWRVTPNKNEAFKALFHEHKWRLLGVVTAMCGLVVLYYLTHLKLSPVTNRRRFIVFTESQFKKISEAEYKQMYEEYEGKLLAATHPIYEQVTDVIMKLLKGNMDLLEIKKREWTVYIVDDEKVKNAIVLPNGEIFVFTGFLQTVDNTEQLAAVLAHEMAHVVLSHSPERVSFFNFVDFILIVVLAGGWVFLPNDGIPGVAEWYKKKAVQLLRERPYNSHLESEADEIGLKMAAKACFDVREGAAFWEGMALRSDASLKADSNVEGIEFLSTHPAHMDRADHLLELMPEAIELRKSCNCAALPKTDPMESVDRLRKRLEEERTAGRLAAMDDQIQVID